MWRWVVLALALAAVAFASANANALARERFQSYEPGAFTYTSSAVSSDPCPFAPKDGVQLLQRAGADTSVMCNATANGLRIDKAYYADAGDLATSSYCLEEAAGGPRVREVAEAAGATVTPLNAPTLAALLASAQDKAPKGTPQASMLLVAQTPGYGGAFMTSTRAAGFKLAAFEAGAKHKASDVSLAGMLLTVPRIQDVAGLDKALTTAFRASSQLCNMKCVDEPTKRCGCASGPGASCMATRMKDYADYGSPTNTSTYWVVYQGGF